MNPLFNQMSKTGNTGGLPNILQQFQQFRQAFRGDPRQQIQQLLNSGRISQAQYNQAVQLAQQLQQMLK